MDTNENKYVNPKIMINFLENVMNMDFQRIQMKVYKTKINITEEEIKKFLQNRNKNFDPHTLEFFKKYLLIIREKSLILLNIIDQIANNDAESIKYQLDSLDIKLDENGRILHKDFIRLINPTIYNIKDLFFKAMDANNLSTYITFNLSEQYSGKNNIELLPLEKLQIMDLKHSNEVGYVPLSSSQKKQLEEQNNKGWFDSLIGKIKK